MADEMPRVLIEDWLPIEALGVESKRERGASNAMPPIYYLHVWWARRPLTVSRAAILGSILPQWSPDWPQALLDSFPTRTAYLRWFDRLTGIQEEVVQSRKVLDWAKRTGTRLRANPFEGIPRAFSVNPVASDLQLMRELLKFVWRTDELIVLDPFAGGGSIPFEALRYGFTTISNDLNPVASVIQKATLDYPARFGASFAKEIHTYGYRLNEEASQKLECFFPMRPGERVRRYLWARTVTCPVTGKLVPLSPNWWLSGGSDPIAVKMIADSQMDTPRFEIQRGDQINSLEVNAGTMSHGVARSPWTGETISSEYIKSEAQAGRMGQVLYALSIETSDGEDFRIPTKEDLRAVDLAEQCLAEKRPAWIAQGIIPTEPFPEGNDNRPLQYGMPTWSDFFSPRQLLTIGMFVEKLRELEAEIAGALDPERARAVLTYCSLALNKCPNYNSYLSSWHASRQVTRSVFDRHDFSFKWTFVEMTMPNDGFLWAVDQVVKAYRELVELMSPAQIPLWAIKGGGPVDRLQILQQTASQLPEILDDSVHNITVDPPYYDNVQYAELSDFFYVWLKRSIGSLFPGFFTDDLTNKDDEAVANPARFETMGRKKKQLAEQDYERKMAAAFREMHRVLHPHGVLTVMFTHKRVEAWDTLATALIGAGFVIKASWPVHTESEHSLHQAKKNAAASTILLVCRKRTPSDSGAVWWDDLQGQVRRVAREKALEYVAQGITGVDLYISTFGPTLSVISENWPVLTSDIDAKTGQPRPLRPDMALDLAREEVIRLRKEGLLAGKAIEFDAVTDWYLMAWDAFQAEQFPYDEARKLAIALGLEVEDTLMRAKRLVTKKGEYIVLQEPAQRRRKGMVDPDVGVFEHLIDALHTAMMVYDEDGAGACDIFLMNRGLKHDTTFKAGLQALINAIPRTRVKNKFARPEADILDRIRLAFYADELTVPPEEEPELPRAEQLGLFVGEFEEDFEDGEEEDEDEA